MPILTLYIIAEIEECFWQVSKKTAFMNYFKVYNLIIRAEII